MPLKVIQRPLPRLVKQRNPQQKTKQLNRYKRNKIRQEQSKKRIIRLKLPRKNSPKQGNNLQQLGAS
ncbi:hypothetical protein HMPREF1342_01376 [Enterococcus faecalis ERV85]|nr:hypothetical protein HMPREF1331_03013 [Enterococcus faecalis ERV25]EJV35083.1 hypothetical protein HMPREF1342_01376 [Enterococcus faecalis ERV85]